MNEPLLSICIPTYNRAAILQETSRLLIRAIKESGHLSEVEICISDNASTDRTPDVIAALRTSGVNFQSWRAPENRGMFATSSVQPASPAASISLLQAMTIR